MNEGAAGAPLTLLSPDEVWDRADPLVPDLGVDPARAALADLPYAKLLGPGFERLCYELLVAEGHSPRFFGRSGQRDYGVDIVVEAGDTRTVYQCKNVTDPPTWTDIRDAVAKFESDWLGEAGLPAHHFVYCCPHPLDHKDLGELWTRFRDEFRARTGVEISPFWDKHALDTKLHRLPDVVAGLFSGSYAEHFCGRDNWRLDDPWSRVCWGKPRHPSIQRFLDRHERGAIHIADHEEERFLDLMSGSGALAIRGMPGSGKTLCGLELGCRMRLPMRPLYYATLYDSSDPERLWQSVRRRSGLPALFVLDDCHEGLERAGMILERLRPELESGTVKLLLVLRDLPRSAYGWLDDTPEWLARLEQDGAVIDMKTDLKRTRAVTEHLRPDMVGLSTQRIERLHHFTGGDLLLLDELLNGVTSPLDLDALRPDKLYQSIRTRYFEGNHLLPTICRLACLAQFELTPLASFLDDSWLSGEKDLAAPLMTKLFAPPRYLLLHSSLAELVLRALLTLEVGVEHLEEKVADATGSELVAYFQHLLALQAKGDAIGAHPTASLEILLRNRLKLVEGPAEARIKAHCLSDSDTLAHIEAHLDRCTFTFLHICLINLIIASHPAKGRYVELIEERFRILFQRGREGSDILGLATVGTGFFALARNAATTLETVQTEHRAEGFLRLIAANGTLFELFTILKHATPAFREELLGQFDDATAGALVDKTIAAGRSIGTLNLAMRELGEADEKLEEDKRLLGRLEQAIGAGRFLRLIAANGTLFELFMILKDATPGFREALLGQLDEATAGALVEKTIASGRSIGTLNLAMRELGKADEDLLGRLEQAIGAGRLLRLIAANGTLFELFMILKHATPTFREALLGELAEATSEALVYKTIAAGRSIGTLHLAMRELGEADEKREEDERFLGRLEQAIGAGRFLRLIEANGTLFELFRILQYATPGFREALLGQLDDARAGALVDKTIAAGRSIGTLHLAMRELGEADEKLEEDERLLGRLEQAIGASRFLRLICANGTLFELFMILKHATPTFREALLGQLSEATAEALVDKTIATGRSIGTLNLAMRELGKADEDLLGRLEQAIGAGRFLRLIAANGTLIELFKVVENATPGFRAALLGQLDDASAGALVDKTIASGRSIESFHYTLRQLAQPSRQRERLQEWLGIEGWWRLIIGVGTLNSVCQLSREMSDDFRVRFIGASSKLSSEDWSGITVRGLFLNACSFATEALAACPAPSQTAFGAALAQAAAPLAAKASWFDLNPSRPPTDLASVEGRILREALQPRIKAFKVEELIGLDLREAVNAFAFGWREREDLHPALAAHLWDIIPDSARWPREDGEVTAFSLVLVIARSEAISNQDTVRLLETTRSFLDYEVCADIHTLPLFLLVWNMAGLRYERGADRSFHGTLPDTLVETLLAVLRERVRPKGPNDEKLAQLALAGLLGFLVPQIGNKLCRILVPLASITGWLYQEALEQTFLPALFALEGIALFRPNEPVLTPLVSVGLLAKSKQYDEVGPAIEHLCERVKGHGALR